MITMRDNTAGTQTLTYPNLDLPHPPRRLPLLGDLLALNPTKPTQTALKDAQRLGGIYERRIINYPIVTVSDPALIAEINNEEHWTKHLAVILRKLRPIARDGLFTARNDEPNWQRAHNILAPAFTKSAMVRYHHSMCQVAGELVDHWAAHQGEWIDVASEMNKFTLEVIARCGFDYSFDSFGRTDDHPFVAAMLRGLTYVNRNANLPPFLQRTLGRRAASQHKRDIAYVHRVVDDVISARRNEHSDSLHHDLLDLMLSTTDPASGTPLDDANIRNQILTFLVAGHETSAGVLALALYEIARTPTIASRAYAEVARFPAQQRPTISYEDVARMRYLRRIVDETLRLWPIAPGYFREAKHDDVVIGAGDRYRFNKGDWVFVLTLQAHRDRATWGDDAEQFDPDRWLPERSRHLEGNVYKPFGTGLRACIGRQFAYHEILLALANLVHAFEFTPEPAYTLDVAEQITLKPKGFRLRATPRRGV